MLKNQTKFLIAIVFLALASTGASASTFSSGSDNFGGYIGTFYGPDNEEWFDNSFGLDVNFVESITLPATSEGLLSIVNPVLNDDGNIIGGEWVYTGPEIVRYLAFGAGPLFSLFEFTDGTNTGFFNTSTLLNKPIEYLTVYSAEPIPLPAAIWFLLSGLAGLLGFGKRKRR